MLGFIFLSMEKERKNCICSLMPCFWKYSSAGCKSVKCGCDTTNCGLLYALVDGKPVLSCSVPACLRVNERHVTTLEGIQDEAEAFGKYLVVGEGAEQCGFCSPGLVNVVAARRKNWDHPTDDEIRHYLEAISAVHHMLSDGTHLSHISGASAEIALQMVDHHRIESDAFML